MKARLRRTNKESVNVNSTQMASIHLVNEVYLIEVKRNTLVILHLWRFYKFLEYPKIIKQLIILKKLYYILSLLSHILLQSLKVGEQTIIWGGVQTVNISWRDLIKTYFFGIYKYIFVLVLCLRVSSMILLKNVQVAFCKAILRVFLKNMTYFSRILF